MDRITELSVYSSQLIRGLQNGSTLNKSQKQKFVFELEYPVRNTGSYPCYERLHCLRKAENVFDQACNVFAAFFKINALQTRRRCTKRYEASYEKVNWYSHLPDNAASILRMTEMNAMYENVCPTIPVAI